MRYCTRCVLPDTRPNLILDHEGICNACRNHESRPAVNWDQRKKEFEKVVREAAHIENGYDCLIPVSGGKDSIWQVVTALQYGLHPLCVTWAPPSRTDIGRINLDSLIALGVDHIDYHISPVVERIFTLKALKKFGNPAIPMHMALFNIPLTIAVRFRIPLVIFGENSAVEYGSDSDYVHSYQISRSWLRTYGVMSGTAASDWISSDLSNKDLTAYFGPDDGELERSGVKAVFLGDFFPWDPENSLKVALRQGFKVREEGPKTGLYNYADIDDNFISIHHWMKWYKFGFTRLFDNLSLEIRNGRMTREEAVALIRKVGDQTPYEDIALFCEFLRITQQDFHTITEKFRNQDVWKLQDGHWFIPDFIISDWKWV